jgi:hypothetical protein
MAYRKYDHTVDYARDLPIESSHVLPWWRPRYRKARAERGTAELVSVRKNIYDLVYSVNYRRGLDQ